MSRPIEIQVVTQAETKELEQIPDALEDVEKGLKDVEDAGKDTEKALDKSFGKVEDSLEDVKKEGEKTGEKLEDSFKDVEKTSERVGKEIDKDLTKALEEVKDEAKTTGKTVGKELDDGFDKAKRGADEFKDEAASSSREAAASFTGDFEDVGDLIQETLANAFAGFGPAGAAAGMAAAAGIGILITSLQNSAEEAEATKEKVLEIADALREVDGDVRKLDWAQITRDWANEIVDPKSWFEPWQKEPITAAEKAKEFADEYDITFSTLAQALAGHTEAGKAALSELNSAYADSQAETQRLIDLGIDPLAAAYQSGETAIGNQIAAVETSTGLTEGAVESYGLQEEAVEGLGEAHETLAEKVELSNDAVRTAANLALGARGAQREWIEAIEAADAALAENGATLDTNTAAGRANEQALDDLAQAGLDNVFAAQENGAAQEELDSKMAATREEIVKQAIEFGMTREEAEKYATELGLVPGTVKTDVTNTADKARGQVENYVSSFTGIPLTVDTSVNFKASISQAQAEVNRIAALVRSPTVTGNLKFIQRAT